MRRIAAAAVLAVAVTILVGAPALATKDPFKPLVTSEQAATATTTGATTTTTTTAQDPAAPTEPLSESVPNTGADVATWLVVAYGLVAAGAGALVLARTLRPSPAW